MKFVVKDGKATKKVDDLYLAEEGETVMEFDRDDKVELWQLHIHEGKLSRLFTVMKEPKLEIMRARSIMESS